MRASVVQVDSMRLLLAALVTSWHARASCGAIHVHYAAQMLLDVLPCIWSVCVAATGAEPFAFAFFACLRELFTAVHIRLPARQGSCCPNQGRMALLMMW